MEDIVQMLLVWSVIFTPIAGLTLRFALKPLVESIAKAMERRPSNTQQIQPDVARRIEVMEQEIEAMRLQLERHAEQRDFYERLAPARKEGV